ncbi:MAG: hypothetical protein KME45_25895 [Stenomitos rutilans HA7619-LM2]|jgi:hypothetical protein|nr:hypothetical protein [Stenomitos rutilans HA7619-LM2]
MSEMMKLQFVVCAGFAVMISLPVLAQRQSSLRPATDKDIVLPAPPTPQMNRQREAAIAAYDPVIRLIAHTTLMDKLAAAGKLTFSASQSKALTALLKDLSARKDLPPAAAKEILTSLRHLLTSDQIKAVETAWQERDDARRQAGAPQEMVLPDGRRARFDSSRSAPAPEQGLPSPPPGQSLPSPPTALPTAPPTEAQGGMDAAIAEGKPFNPFNPNDIIAGKAVQNLLTRLKAHA